MTGPVAGQTETFQEDAKPAGGDHAKDAAGELFVALESYEGPIDLLLDQARAQKVDMSKISVLALANQYLDFIEQAENLRIELAADYLVMAAWLAYLKSRLLLPADETEDDEPSGEELAAAFTRRLQRLDAMRRAGEALMARRIVGRDWYASGRTPELQSVKTTAYDVSLYDLLKAYAEHRRPSEVIGETYRTRLNLVSVDEAVRRFSHLLGVFPGWNRLEGFLPKSLVDKLHSRSALASHFVAALELAKSGKVELRQNQPFAPIYVRASPDRVRQTSAGTTENE
ncbi:ScpA family protein [Fodinicurvata sp. EGI_FJ10296]|uniref:segregation and condensation protein A n=1 Tax=Fodinicurvata sp. EGI_FJ10296 TaxID=3231908 RepID=UPI00345262A9